MIIHKRATGNYIANLDINLLRRQRIICVSRAREGKKGLLLIRERPRRIPIQSQ